MLSKQGEYSHCLMPALMLNEVINLQKQKDTQSISQIVEANQEFGEYHSEESGSSHSHLADVAREM